MRRGRAAVLACLLVAACAETGRVAVGESPAAAPRDDGHPTAGGVDEAAIDRAVSPCDDFYAYACGGWLAKNPVPDDKAVWTRSFGPMDEANEAALRPILEQAASAPAAGDDEEKKLGDFYASCIDEPAIAQRGLMDLAGAAATIDAGDLARALATLHAHGVGALFSLGVTGDPFDATQVALSIGAPTLGLPDREAYFSDEPGQAELRARYRAHVARTLALAGDTDDAARAEATEVLAIERALARAALGATEARDPSRVHHARGRAALVALAPAVDWDAYLAALHLSPDVPIDVAQPSLLAAAASIAGTSPPGALRAYLRFQLLRAVTPVLGGALGAEDFAMQSRLFGARLPPPRWKACVRITAVVLGDAVGRRYVKAARGGGGAREAALRMTKALEDALRRRIARAAWMDRDTRDRAEAKLSLLRNVVGYPEVWRRYDALAVDRGAFVANVWAAAGYEVERVLARIGRPPAPDEWRTSAAEATAFYDPTRNEMVLPLGLLRAPMYANDAPDAVNYGALGMVIGHELSHGFDDEGRLYDEHGELDAWWTADTEAAFDVQARCVADEFDGFVGEGGAHVNGGLTLGEDLADLGGLALAYEAAAPSDARAAQEVFLGFAQAWCTNTRPEAARLRLRTNPHAPPRFRVDGTVANMPEFAAAFGCSPGSPMVREKRCTLW